MRVTTYLGLLVAVLPDPLDTSDVPPKAKTFTHGRHPLDGDCQHGFFHSRLAPELTPS